MLNPRANPAAEARFPADHSNPLINVSDLRVSFGETVALSGASFHLCRGEFVAVIGPNGAGKSTLLRAMLGLIPFSGHVSFSPALGSHPTERISYVPQQQALDWSFPVTVWDVVMMGRTRRIGWLRRPSSDDLAAVKLALERAGIYELRTRPIAALSGGQRQRVLLARMLTKEGDLLFLDEPFSGVDVKTQDGILELLEAERAAGKAILMVTHDLESARNWCSQIMLVNRTVIASGTPAQVYTAQNIELTFSGVRTRESAQLERERPESAPLEPKPSETQQP
jgi:manganese/iron transport system ATP-binding protein